MVAGHIKFVNQIIEGKSKITDISMLERFVLKMPLMNSCFCRTYKIGKIFYYWIFNNNKFVVKNKRCFKGVWINNRTEGNNQNKMEYRPGEQVCFFQRIFCYIKIIDVYFLTWKNWCCWPVWWDKKLSLFETLTIFKKIKFQ